MAGKETTAATDGTRVSQAAGGLDDLEPRVRAMLRVLLRNRSAICGPRKGVLELHFSGIRVSGKLVAPMVTDLVAEDDDGPDAA